MMQELPTSTQAYNILLQEEKHLEIRAINNEPNDSLACKVEKRKFQEKGKNQSEGNKTKRTLFYYDHCRISGHTKERCWKLIGYSTNFKGNSTTSQHITVEEATVTPTFTLAQYQQILEMLNKLEKNKSTSTYAKISHLTGMFCLTTLKDDEWIIDSDASDHMCHNLSEFLSYDRIHSITIPDGRNIPIKYIGHVKLNNDIVLHNVLYVPQYRFNLIVVSKILSDMHGLVSFDTNKCYLQKILKKRTYLLGKIKSSLYIFEDHRQHKNANVTTECCTRTASKSILHKAKLWHLRMGHLPINRLKFLFPKITENLAKPHMFCTICPLGKHTRNVYPKSFCKSQKPLELLHIDVWGHFRYKTRTNCSKFITIVDDFRKMWWIFLIKQKSEFTDVFKNFVVYIENQ